MSPERTEVLQAFATLRRHLPATLRAAEAELEAAWFNGGPLPVDWPARLRAAAEVAAGTYVGDHLRAIAGLLVEIELPPDVVAAVGRALLGEES